MKKSVFLCVLLALLLVACGGETSPGSSSNGQGDQPKVDGGKGDGGGGGAGGKPKQGDGPKADDRKGLRGKPKPGGQPKVDEDRSPHEREQQAAFPYARNKLRNGAIEFYHHEADKCGPNGANPINSWLGNFHIVANGVEVNRFVFKTAEAAFQAGKCFYCAEGENEKENDEKFFQCMKDFMDAKDGEEAFQVSRKPQYKFPSENASKGWDNHRDERMMDVIKAKFSKFNPDLLESLCATKGIPLIEIIPESRIGQAGAIYWGQAPTVPGRDIIGKNILGKMLEQHRERVCP